ncbi:MAG TPA: hypothetical protein VGF24_32380 [Vicinamibacterales bacterium]
MATLARRTIRKPKSALRPASVIGNRPLTNMAACVADASAAIRDRDPGPADPRQFADLMTRLTRAKSKLAPIYQQGMFDPFVATLTALGENEFKKILASDVNNDRAGRLMMDIAQALLQPGEGFQHAALRAFQELVSDLYDGFLSAEDRRGVKPPDRGVTAPMVKFGEPRSGPYTWPIEATGSFRVRGTPGPSSAVVSLPPSNGRLGLMAWSSIGHETAGHDILSADRGLKSEIADTVADALTAGGLRSLAEYWSERIDETASDVMGILNMGPAAGIGLIAFFRGFDGLLRSDGPTDDPHPADVLRGFLASATVRLLEFDDHNRWADVIRAETVKDMRRITIAGRAVTPAQAEKSAAIVAQTVVTTRLRSLERTPLGRIQNWRNADEKIADRLRAMLIAQGPLPNNFGSDAFAAHAVAAAVLAGLAGQAAIPDLQTRMIKMLNVMHDQNASFGPLFVSQPGNISAHFDYKELMELTS